MGPIPREMPVSIIEMPRNVIVGDLYERVHAAINTEASTVSERIAVLELVKAELLRDALERMRGG